MVFISELMILNFITVLPYMVLLIKLCLYVFDFKYQSVLNEFHAIFMIWNKVLDFREYSEY